MTYSRSSPVIRGLLVPGVTVAEQQHIIHGLHLVLDHIRTSLTSGKVRAADSDTLCIHTRTQPYTICAPKAQVMPHNGQLNLCQVIGGHLAQAVPSFNAAQIVGTHLTRCLHIVPFWHCCLQLAMESHEIRCNSNEMKFLKWLTAQDESLEHPLFWCQALHVLHSSSHLTGFCMSTYCEFTPMQGLQVLPCCLHAFVGIAANLQIYLTTFSAQSLRFYQVTCKPKQTQIPLGWPHYGMSNPAAGVCCARCYRTAAARMAYAFIVCQHVLHAMKTHVHAHV